MKEEKPFEIYRDVNHAKLKKFLMYTIMVVIFFVFSNFLINVGINSTYKRIEGKNNVNQLDITTAEATLVNGRISGKLNTEMTSNLYQKYIKIDLYSPRDVLLGTKYVEMKDVAIHNNSFEIYFKLQDAKRYEISLVDEKQYTENEELFDIHLTQGEIILGVIIALMFI